jgi:3-oxosteroid 1-dehydrogenase
MLICSGADERGFDVVVVGSGGSGLTAALAALHAGARVAVLEKGRYLGGTTALSGGMLWMPGNELPGAPDAQTDRADARRYLERLTFGRAEAAMLDAHLERVPETLEFLATVGGLRFELIGNFPDYESSFDGACHSGGRSLEPVLYDATQLGPLAEHVRPDPRPPFRQVEYFEGWKRLHAMPVAELEQRAAAGIAARGRALVSPLVKALADRGATLIADCRAERLVVEDGRVASVVAGGERFDAQLGVVLASGGFEYDDDMVRRFLSGPIQGRCGTPNNEGDGQKMAMAVGADMAGMGEAWWGVMANGPGLTVDGRRVSTMLTVERCLPGTIIVNRFGRRFVNESISYYGMGKVFATFDPRTFSYPNLPAFLVGDADFFENYGMLGAHDLGDLPEWVASSDTLTGLAAQLGIDPDGLQQTVERFNAHARAGHDPEFGRGESSYSRYFGDEDHPCHPNLAPIERGPFVAIQALCGAIGTKGGVRTDVDGRALDPFGDVLPGLSAAGNASAHPIAFGYTGAGGTLGPAMTMAYAAGSTLARATAPA